MLELDSGGPPVTGECLKCEGGQVIGGKVKELKSARRSLSVDMDISRRCDRVVLNTRTVSWGPSE